MGVLMEEAINPWTARLKSALVLQIIQAGTTLAEASRHYDVTPAGIESRVEDGRRGLKKPVSSTSAGSRNCRKRTASPCWSCALEKKGHDHFPRTQAVFDRVAGA